MGENRRLLAVCLFCVGSCFAISSLSGADVSGDERPLRCEGMMLALLGTADPSTLRTWFARLSEGGRIVDGLQTRPWGASDGQVIDRYGLHWLIGFESDESH